MKFPPEPLPSYAGEVKAYSTRRNNSKKASQKNKKYPKAFGYFLCYKGSMFDTLVIFGAKHLWLVALFIGALYFFLQSKELKNKIILFAAIVFPVTYIIAKGIGFFYYNPQPFVVEQFVPLIAHVPDNGFPSDHTLLVAALASVIFFYNRFLGSVIFLLAFAIGISRVFAGVHHVVDIIGSIVIAMIVTTIVHYILKKIKRRTIVAVIKPLV